jgi:hypothetical protein
MWLASGPTMPSTSESASIVVTKLTEQLLTISEGRPHAAADGEVYYTATIVCLACTIVRRNG